jgi:hypothetical protein
MGKDKRENLSFDNEAECVECLSLLLANAEVGHSLIRYSEDEEKLVFKERVVFLDNKELKAYIGNLPRSSRYIAFSLDINHKNICFRGRQKVISLSVKENRITLDFYADETCNPYLMTETEMRELIKKHENRFNTSLEENNIKLVSGQLRESELEFNLINIFKNIEKGCWVYPILLDGDKVSFDEPTEFENQAKMRRYLWGQKGTFYYIAIVNFDNYSKITMRTGTVVKSFENFKSNPSVSYFKDKSSVFPTRCLSKTVPRRVS